MPAWHNYCFQTIKSDLQALNDDSIPLELALKPFVIYNEGENAIQELTSTQTMIASLINTDDDESQSEAMKELKICVEKYQNILRSLENNDIDKTVRLSITAVYKIYKYLIKNFFIHMFLF